MKLDTETLLLPQRAPGAWPSASVGIGLLVAALLAMYWRTAASLVAIWDSSQTYAHGYLIVPLALFLVWRKRDELARLAPRPDYLGVVMLALAGGTWLVAAAADVQVIEQYALVAMIPAAVVALAGRETGRALAFPLAFLLFAVPFGEAFVPRLMDWTADFTVGALQLSGIPVFREGTSFELPTGRWSVVEACSGIRYLIASVTVGTLYAYLNYRKLAKRLLFIAVSIVLPVLANFVRAYLIVMIGHLSSMKLAVGIDHLIYGWVFFGAVMLLLFWLGSFWRDDAPGRAGVEPAAPRPVGGRSRFAAMGLAAALVAGGWPLYAAQLERAGRGAVALAAPAASSGWEPQPAQPADWQPHYRGAAASFSRAYRKDGRTVVLYLAYYRGQRQGAELVSSRNTLAVPPQWVSIGQASRDERLAQRRIDVRQTLLRSASQRLLVWDWYRVAGHDTASPYLAKALLARDRLLYRADDSFAIVVAAPYAERPDAAARVLGEFTSDMLPAIDAALAQAAKGAR